MAGTLAGDATLFLQPEGAFLRPRTEERRRGAGRAMPAAGGRARCCRCAVRLL